MLLSDLGIHAEFSGETGERHGKSVSTVDKKAEISNKRSNPVVFPVKQENSVVCYCRTAQELLTHRPTRYSLL
jgi:hypothetical protein